MVVRSRNQDTGTVVVEEGLSQPKEKITLHIR